MGSINPKEVKTTIFEISADELEARMEAKRKLQDEPCQKAVMLLEAALDKVLTSLGVDVTQSPEVIHAQQEFLGITIMENTEESTPQLNGFFVFVTRNGDPAPHSWIGAARINSMGQVFCDIQWFLDNRLEETGGVKLVG